MSGSDTAPMTGDWSERILALLVVVACAAIGGILTQIAMFGLTFKTGKIGPINIHPLINSVKIPPLVGMIIFGCLARNFLCREYMQHYPEPVAYWLRNVCLSVILLRGGMELDFAGKGLTVVLLTFVPQNFEAVGAALATRWIFKMPWSLCFAQGFTLGAVSPAVLVPSMMILQNAGYGVKKGIPTSMIAASSFDDIVAITVFSVFLTISFNEVEGGAVGEDGAPVKPDLLMEVGLNVG